MSRRYFRPLRDELAGAVDVHAPDLPGFGDAPRPPRALTVPELAEALAGTAADAGLDEAVVVANSMGCQVAVELAIRRPELVRALVLVGPTVDPAGASLARHTARLLADVPREPLALTAVVAVDYVRAGPLRTLRSARRMIEHRIETRLPLVRQEAIVVRGSRDPIAPQRWAAEAAVLLPRGRVEVVPGAAHAAHWSHPAKVAAIALSLAGTSAAAET